MNYLLDTNVCIALLKGHERELIRQFQSRSPEDFYLCSIVKGELLYGARKSQKIEENLRLLSKFFSQFESLPFDDRAAEYYGTMRAILVKAGTPIGANDLLIASIAQAYDLILLTRDRKEFSQIPGLRMESW